MLRLGTGLHHDHGPSPTLRPPVFLVVEIPPPQSSPTLCIGLLEDVFLAPSTLLPFVSTTRFEVEDERAPGTQIPIVIGMNLLWLDGHLKRHTMIVRAREAYRRPRLDLDYERSKRAAMTIVPAYRGGRVSENSYPGIYIQEAYVDFGCHSADLPDGGRAVNLWDHKENTRWGRPGV